MKPREVCRRIERLGGVCVRQKGSHRMYAVRDADGHVAMTTVSWHTREVKPGTLRAIERELEPALGRRWLRR